MHAHEHARARAHTRIQLNRSAPVQEPRYKHARTRTRTSTYIHIPTHTHTIESISPRPGTQVYTCTRHVITRTCTYARTSTRTCMHTCTWTRTCMHARTRTRAVGHALLLLSAPTSMCSPSHFQANRPEVTDGALSSGCGAPDMCVYIDLFIESLIS